ncbi:MULTISPECIES: hypothetical protein [Rhodanobacter]|uniref:hypothetical protein n=1 Tax=Rhodanobacter TaxID=75309 RepID=UPI001639690A|nr:MULTISPECIES: hypothetical protein [Rhodanobacter]UJJ55010.1 hypothetical protein LRK53_00965 [Rhodanobacter thiooxydans]
MAACTTWPFSDGPKDVRVTSVTGVDFKDQPQLKWVSLKPRPSKIILRIEFTTDTDLLALAKKKDYNVSFALGPCSKEGVKDMGVGYGYVYWNTLRIYSDAKETSDYATAIAKGPPYSYQVFATPWQPGTVQGPMCFTLAGGNMIGGKLRSNDAMIPNQAF